MDGKHQGCITIQYLGDYGLVKAPPLAGRSFSIGLLSAPQCGRFGGRGQSSSCFWVTWCKIHIVQVTFTDCII